MSNEMSHLIRVGVRILKIGSLNIQGELHAVTPLELHPERLVFLCRWPIPITPNVKLGYEINDGTDQIRLAGRIVTEEPFMSSYLYHAEIYADQDQKSRITGMLNRMITDCRQGRLPYPHSNKYIIQ